MTYSLKDRAAIITGGSQGFGLEVARAFVAAGANILICARNAEQVSAAREELLAQAAPGQSIHGEIADVSQAQDVERIAAAAWRLFPQVHILVNNAGVYGPKGLIEDVDWESWVHAIQINLLGSVLMCRAVLPHLRAHGYGKIIQLSGGGATNPLPRISAYAASKAAVVRFAETLAEEVKDAGIDVNSIAPGALNTRLLDEVLADGPEKVGRAFYDRAVKQKAEGGAPLTRGAELAVFLASSASDGLTGKILSAVWDPWPTLSDHLRDLQQSDVYTLRRIVPKDRGLTWDE
jgi:NAD(P)-dependent dehydrogenase (short-subunit alcohol dehydrogenase family)